MFSNLNKVSNPSPSDKSTEIQSTTNYLSKYLPGLTKSFDFIKEKYDEKLGYVPQKILESNWISDQNKVAMVQKIDPEAAEQLQKFISVANTFEKFQKNATEVSETLNKKLTNPVANKYFNNYVNNVFGGSNIRTRKKIKKKTKKNKKSRKRI